MSCFGLKRAFRVSLKVFFGLMEEIGPWFPSISYSNRWGLSRRFQRYITSPIPTYGLKVMAKILRQGPVRTRMRASPYTHLFLIIFILVNFLPASFSIFYINLYNRSIYNTFIYTRFFYFFCKFYIFRLNEERWKNNFKVKIANFIVK